jgi:hypothetical protein
MVPHRVLDFKATLARRACLEPPQTRMCRDHGECALIGGPVLPSGESRPARTHRATQTTEDGAVSRRRDVDAPSMPGVWLPEQRADEQQDAREAGRHGSVPDEAAAGERGDGAERDGHLEEGDGVGELVVAMQQVVCLL